MCNCPEENTKNWDCFGFAGASVRKAGYDNNRGEGRQLLGTFSVFSFAVEDFYRTQVYLGSDLWVLLVIRFESRWCL